MSPMTPDDELERLLQAAADDERRGADGDADVEPDVDADELLAGLDRDLNAMIGANASRGPGWSVWSLAAALVLVVAGFFLARSELYRPIIGPPTPLELGEGDVRCDAPRGRVVAFDDFRWSHGTDAVSFTLIVEAADGGATILRRTRLRGASYRPTAEEIASLPGRIDWKVLGYDATGALVGTDSAAAERGP